MLIMRTKMLNPILILMGFPNRGLTQATKYNQLLNLGTKATFKQDHSPVLVSSWFLMLDSNYNTLFLLYGCGQFSLMLMLMLMLIADADAADDDADAKSNSNT